MECLLKVMKEQSQLDRVDSVGHRVVHGGSTLTSAQPVTPQLIQKIEALSYLAPLHNPINVLGIRAAQAALPALPHVAVFDTAFHHTLPDCAYRYAVPESWYETHGVRKYGFHGTSHRFVAERTAQLLGRPLEDLCLIVAHLGNGSSACAVKGGLSVETTMGLTPLAGLVMGTRSGDVDPGLHGYMAKRLDGGLDAVEDTLNRHSGLLGLSGVSNDMRTLLERETAGHAGAALAIRVYCYRLSTALAALGAALPRLDALVFTGGVGEHAAPIRERVIERLWGLGVTCDRVANASGGQARGGRISRDQGTAVFVVPTDEEWMIAKDTARIAAREI